MEKKNVTVDPIKRFRSLLQQQSRYSKEIIMSKENTNKKQPK